MLRTGEEWEKIFKGSIEMLGLPIEDWTRKRWSYDFVVNTHRVQCKDLKLYAPRKTVWIAQGSKTRYEITQVDFFAIRLNGFGVFIVPPSALARSRGDQRFVAINQHLSSLLPFRNRWDLLKTRKSFELRHMQRPLF